MGFSEKCPIFGPFSTGRRLMGAQNTPLGSVNINNGEFIANEVLVNGAFSQATISQILKQKGHQFLLDYGVDTGIYVTGSVVIVIQTLEEKK